MKIIDMEGLLVRLVDNLVSTSASEVSEGDEVLKTQALCVPKTSSALISRKNRLTSAHHDCADVFHTRRLGLAIQVEEPA